jgi:hypothetical protein
MSYEVPNYPPLPRRWPHWYGLLSLAFHGGVIWRGSAINQSRALSGHSFSDWFGDQQVLFIASSFLAFACLLSLTVRTRAMEIVILNAPYSVLVIFSLLMHVSILNDGSSSSGVFADLGGIMLALVLLNTLYSVFRYLTRHER